jgi:hypothetical protein
MITIPIPEMKVRGVYRCDGRNYSFAVWDGKVFIGCRHKFGWRLSAEQHHDSDPSFGTVRPLEFICSLPDHIEMETMTMGREMNYALFGYLTVVADSVRQQMRDEGRAEM